MADRGAAAGSYGKGRSAGRRNHHEIGPLAQENGAFSGEVLEHVWSAYHTIAKVFSLLVSSAYCRPNVLLSFLALVASFHQCQSGVIPSADYVDGNHELYLYIYLSIYLCIYLSTYLSIFLSVCLSFLIFSLCVWGLFLFLFGDLSPPKPLTPSSNPQPVTLPKLKPSTRNPKP